MRKFLTEVQFLQSYTQVKHIGTTQMKNWQQPNLTKRQNTFVKKHILWYYLHIESILEKDLPLNKRFLLSRVFYELGILRTRNLFFGHQMTNDTPRTCVIRLSQMLLSKLGANTAKSQKENFLSNPLLEMGDSANIFTLIKCMTYNLYRALPIREILLNKIFSRQQILTHIIQETLLSVLCVIQRINSLDIVVRTVPKVFPLFCHVLLRKSL